MSTNVYKKNEAQKVYYLSFIHIFYELKIILASLWIIIILHCGECLVTVCICSHLFCYNFFINTMIFSKTLISVQKYVK
jgi:hypothetical protein